ncbi:hypothetical protein GUF49_15895, partial [Xanthomonas citri pv. citri]|nr:hypothetical protein [Xanthomonas citri pv. citri]
KEFNNTIVFEKDSVADVAGLKYTLNVKVTDNGYKGTIAMGGKNGTVDVVATGDGFTQTTVVDGVTGKRFYTRA